MENFPIHYLIFILVQTHMNAFLLRKYVLDVHICVNSR